MVAIALPSSQSVLELDLPQGSTVADALAAASVVAHLEGLDRSSLRTGIWSRPCAADAPLREGDRVELYRPLIADAKEMRRERARKPPR